MSTPGTDNGNMLGAGIGSPTCWQYFGFDGPTNKHNLDTAYHERLSRASFGTIDPVGQTVFTAGKYQECLEEIGDSTT